MRTKDPWPLIGLASLSLVGLVLVTLGTRWGAAISYDSFQYLTAAENLALGRGLAWSAPDGLVVPLTHYPPLLSVVVAILIRSGFSSMAAIQTLNIALFGLNIYWTGVAARRLTNSAVWGLLAPILFLLSDVMIQAHAEAMSEALYMALSVPALLLLSDMDGAWKPWKIATAGLLAAAAWLTRYAGLSLLLAGGTVLLLRPGRPRRDRMAAAALFVGLAAVPMLIWIGRTYMLSGEVANRSLAWHPAGLEFLAGMVDLLLTWFAPGRWVHGRSLQLLGAAIALGLLLWAAGRRWAAERSPAVHSRESSRWAGLLLVYAISYGTVFVVAKWTFDELIYLDNRLLSPMLQALLLLTAFALHRLSAVRFKLARPAAVILSLALVGLYAGRTHRVVKWLYEEGAGYTARGFHESSTIALLQRLDDRPVFTNAVPAVYFWTGRIPYTITPLGTARERVTAECGLLVVFHSIPLDLFGVTEPQVSEGMLIEAYSDAEAYYAPICSSQLAPWLRSPSEGHTLPHGAAVSSGGARGDWLRLF